MSQVYDKPPLSINEQIALLEARGLHIPDKDEANHYLSFISYYRLSGYAITYEGRVQGKRDHQFKPYISFKDIINLYDFDRLLRLLVMDAMGRIEIAVRTQICLKLALNQKDSHWYLNKNLFKPKFNFEKFMAECNQEFSRSREVFARHYKSTYQIPALPPSWMMIELLSIGTYSFLYQNIKNRWYKKQIADVFDLSPIEMQSWLHCLTYLRNLCAHHARLWNRHFTIVPMPKPKYRQYLIPNYVFATQAAVIHILLKIISPKSKWTTRLVQLFKEHPSVSPERMGFAKQWIEDPFWEIELSKLSSNVILNSI